MKLYWLREICVRWKRNVGQLTIAPCSDFCLFSHCSPFTLFHSIFLPLALSLSISLALALFITICTLHHCVSFTWAEFFLFCSFSYWIHAIVLAYFICLFYPVHGTCGHRRLQVFLLVRQLLLLFFFFSFEIFIGKSLRSFTFTVLFAHLCACGNGFFFFASFLTIK